MTQTLRTATAQRAAGLRAMVITDGHLLDERMTELLFYSRVERVRVAVDGPGEAFEQLMARLGSPCRFAVDVCVRLGAHNAQAAMAMRKRVDEVAEQSGNYLSLVDGDALDFRTCEDGSSTQMTPQTIGHIAAPILKKWEEARSWVFGSFACGWADERSDIDMMAELLPGVHVGYRYFDFRRELKEALGRRVELHLPPYKPKDDPFLNVMERSKVLIYEDEAALS